MLFSAPCHLNRIVAVYGTGLNLTDGARTQLNHGYGAHLTGNIHRSGHSDFFANQSAQHFTHQFSIEPPRFQLALELCALTRCYSSLISTSTPAARSSFPNASIVCWVGSSTSSKRLWVLISKCSRDFLSTCGERLTVKRSIRVGNGIGPATLPPVRRIVSTISRTDWSSSR